MRRQSVWYIAFLAALAAVPPLSTDMYLAAIPQIAKGWNASSELVGLTLTLWFASFSLGLLLSGSCSDRYGRRPVLFVGLLGFILGSLLCALAQGPYTLIVFRIIQGFGAAAPSAMAMAICRDRFNGSRRKIALAYIGIMLSLAPIIAPSLGSLILWFADWRVIFFCQSISGVVVFILTLRYTETNKKLATQPVYRLLGRYLVLFQNKGYILTTLTLGLLSGPFYGNVSFSPILYIIIFSRSNSEFSLFFALTALCSVIGAYLFTRINNLISDILVISICLLGVVAAGVGILFWGMSTYYVYLGCAAVIAFCTGLSRPVSNSLVLGFVDKDIGSAASFMVFYQFFIGAICMSLASMEWQVASPVVMFGIMTIAFAALALILWQGVKRFAASR